MGFIKFLRGNLNSLPEEISDGSVYFASNTGTVLVDTATERICINPPADWEETITQSPAYIANKPDLGTASSHDIAS